MVVLTPDRKFEAKQGDSHCRGCQLAVMGSCFRDVLYVDTLAALFPHVRALSACSLVRDSAHRRAKGCVGCPHRTDNDSALPEMMKRA